MADSSWEGKYAAPAETKSDWEQKYAAPDNALEQEIATRGPQATGPMAPGDYPMDGAKGQEALALPAPSPDMYHGMDEESQGAMYDAYARHPQSEQDMMGNVSYAGHNIPKPESKRTMMDKGLDLAGKAAGIGLAQLNPGIAASDGLRALFTGDTSMPLASSLGDAAVGVPFGATVNAAKNLTTGALAQNEEVSKSIAGIENPILQGGAKIAQQTLNPFTGIMDVGNTAGVTAENADKVMPEFNGSNAAQKTGATTGEIGIGALFGGKGVDASTLKQVPGFFKAVSRYAVSTGGSTLAMDPDIKPLVDLMSRVGIDPKTGDFNQQLLKKKLNLFVDAMLIAKPVELGARGIAGASSFVWNISAGALSKWGSMAAKEREAVKESLTMLVKISPEDTPQEIAQKYMSVSKGIRDNMDVSVPSDTPGISDLNIKRDSMSALEKSTNDPESIARAGGLRSAILAKGSGETKGVMANPSKALDQAVNETQTVFGGKQSIEQARKEVVKSAQTEYGVHKGLVPETQADISNATQKFGADLRNDAAMGKSVQSAEDVNFRARQNPAEDKLLKDTTDIRTKLDQERKANMANVSDKIKISTKRLNGLVDQHAETLGPDLVRDIKAADGNAKVLYGDVQKRLSQRIDEFYRANRGTDANGLKTIRDEIKKGFERTEAGKKFTEFFTGKYAPDAKNSPIGRAAEELQANKFDPALGEDNARNTLISVLKNNDRAQGKQLVDILDRHGKDPGVVGDITKGHIANEINDMIAGGKDITDIEVTPIIKRLRDVEAILPEADKAGFRAFTQKIIDAKTNGKALESALGDAKKASDEAYTRIYDKELGKFFEGDNAKTSGYHIFADYFSGNHSDTALDGIIGRVQGSDNELAKQGLKSAWSKYFSDQIAAKGRGPAGEKLINTGVYDKIKNDTTRLMDYGDKIFADNPSVMKIYRAALDEAGSLELSKSANKLPMEDTMRFDKGARGAFDLMVTQVFGVLNRTGSRIRSVAGKYVGSKSGRQETLNAYDTVFAHPEKFASIVDDIAKDFSGSLSMKDKRRVYQFLVMEGGYSRADADKYINLDKAKEETDKVMVRKQAR